MDKLKPGITVLMYDNEQLAVLEGAISLPIGSRVEVLDENEEPVDYIIDTARLGVRPTDFDLYYECHRAEETGTRDLGDLPPVS